MARRVFFSFHYQRDVFRANQVRNSHVVEGTAAANFQDASLWEEAKRHGDAAVRRLIDRALENTSVTAILIGEETFKRQYVSYEIERSIERGNGLLGIRIHMLPDQFMRTCLPGPVPTALVNAGAPVYDWDYSKFGAWVERAAAVARRVPAPNAASNTNPWPAIGFGVAVLAVLAATRANKPPAPPSPFADQRLGFGAIDWRLFNPSWCPSCGRDRVFVYGLYYCASCAQWGP